MLLQVLHATLSSTCRALGTLQREGNTGGKSTIPPKTWWSRMSSLPRWGTCLLFRIIFRHACSAFFFMTTDCDFILPVVSACAIFFFGCFSHVMLFLILRVPHLPLGRRGSKVGFAVSRTGTPRSSSWTAGDSIPSHQQTSSRGAPDPWSSSGLSARSSSGSRSEVCHVLAVFFVKGPLLLYLLYPAVMSLTFVFPPCL